MTVLADTSGVAVFEMLPREVVFGLVGTSFGVLLSLLVQWVLYRYRIWLALRRFRRDIDNLHRHLAASLASLEGVESQPRYFVAARLRFCTFLDGMAAMRDLEWLTRTHASRRILPTLYAIRNSDIFLSEIADRVDGMSDAHLAAALGEARRNLQILDARVALLGYRRVPAEPAVDAAAGAAVIDRLGGFRGAARPTAPAGSGGEQEGGRA